MKVPLTLILALLCCSKCFSQSPYYPYLNNYQYQRQLMLDNQLRIRDQMIRERQAGDSFDEVLNKARKAVELRELKQRERYFRNLNEQMESDTESSNPFIRNNPFLRW